MARRKITNETCYFCGKQAESMEHFPQKSLFPKDLLAKRNLNLVKVPSCKAHNEDKSLGDSYLHRIFLMSEGINEIGMEYAAQAVPRIADKNKKAITAMSYSLRDSYAGSTMRLDMDLLLDVLEHTARAAFYHTYHKAYDGGCSVWYQSTINTDPERIWLDLIRQRDIANSEEFFAGIERVGAVEEVFYYQIAPVEDHPETTHMARLVFYGGIKAVAYFTRSILAKTTFNRVAEDALRPRFSVQQRARIIENCELGIVPEDVALLFPEAKVLFDPTGSEN